MSKGYATLYDALKGCLTKEEIDTLSSILLKVTTNYPELLKRRVKIQSFVNTLDTVKSVRAFFSLEI